VDDSVFCNKEGYSQRRAYSIAPAIVV